MYEAIEGILKAKNPVKAIIAAGGISYRLSIPLSTYKKLGALGEPTHLFLSHIVRADLQALYGFYEEEERNLFELLIGLSGVGPKTALSLIGHMEYSLFHQAIVQANVQLICRIPGIGKKTAERLIVELKDKLSPLSTGGSNLMQDAIRALIHLGYSTHHATEAVRAVKQSEKIDLGSLITQALQEAKS